MPHIVEFPKCAVCDLGDDVRRCPVCDDFVCAEFAYRTSVHLGPDNTDVEVTCDHEHEVLTGDSWIVDSVGAVDARSSVPSEGLSGPRRSLTWSTSGRDRPGSDRDGTWPTVLRPLGPVHGQLTENEWLASIQDLRHELDLLVEQFTNAGRDSTVRRALLSGSSFVRAAADSVARTNRNLEAYGDRPKD